MSNNPAYIVSSMISVCKAEHHPLWCNTIGGDKNIPGFLSEEIINKRSQDLPDFYRLNGAIYLCDIEQLKSRMTFFLKEKISAYIMPQDVSVDIDMRSDLDLAIMAMKGLVGQKNNLLIGSCKKE
jgi:CMP-N,N'-diacetyllegionaminic acid synthase